MITPRFLKVTFKVIVPFDNIGNMFYEPNIESCNKPTCDVSRNYNIAAGNRFKLHIGSSSAKPENYML